MIAPRFTVIWLPDVEAGLADYWSAADSRERSRATDVVHVIDRVLALAPENQGTPDDLEPGVRIWVFRDVPPPVRVAFRLSMKDRLVHVIRVTFFDARHS